MCGFRRPKALPMAFARYNALGARLAFSSTVAPDDTMFEKYNEKARRALFFARYEASKLGSRVIESEHILLGILREGEETVSELFRRLKVKPGEVRREIEGERVFVERISSTAELPLSEESKKILAFASHEAESMLHNSVGSEASSDRTSPGRELLRDQGPDPARLRRLQRSRRGALDRQRARGDTAEEGAAVSHRVRSRSHRAGGAGRLRSADRARGRGSNESSRSCRGGRRTIRSFSASQGLARRRSLKASRSVSLKGRYPSSWPRRAWWHSTCR